MTSDAVVASRLRRFLLIVAAASGACSCAELWFESHTHDWMQILAFVFGGLLTVSAVAALVQPTRGVLRGHRLVMVIVLAGGVLGVVQHLRNNLLFALEIRPNATVADVWYEALSGANPPLAPGILGLAAILAVAGTYGHPALDRGDAAG